MDGAQCLCDGVSSPRVSCRISELIEQETGEYHKADPDPFDDRHPGYRLFTFCRTVVPKFSFILLKLPFLLVVEFGTLCNCAGRADPDCMLGQLLKMLFMNDDFTNAVRTAGSLIQSSDVVCEGSSACDG